MNTIGKLAAIGALLLATQAASAATAAGTWKTIDDESKQPKSLVEISEAGNGELTGKVVKLFNNPDAVCDKCDGGLKGKPIVGMTIMTGLKKDGENWDNGKIVDPKSGKVYSVKAKLVDGGKKLEVHGYIGFSLLGRTQVWERQ
ncbi:DUF2147 domain-containing protein [Vogesella sp. LIG4]|uniref:DUF2147 domain-containing protein n=1 Tax=Vogesella sp. LIG4 TaxID=1192162 RepID=UPI00081FAB86|nr:DUF2147 domain-containing protein [Vogesella sp. LIG4]SCK08348.1 Uncharacterized conserved protein, DUF2147 family [Vogesella sp. LIG4]